MNTLSDRINDAIAEKACTAAELAKAAGVKESSVSDWRSKETKSMKAEPALKAASFLGVSPFWLVLGLGPKRPADTDRYASDLAVRQQLEDYRKSNVLQLHGSPLSSDEQTILEAFRRADRPTKTFLIDSAVALLQRLDGFGPGIETPPSRDAEGTG